jgi:chemotaxis protein histidine kinase CheA
MNAVRRADLFGYICLRAYQKSGNLFLEIEDDGYGFDAQKILDKAVRQKMVPANQKNLAEKDIFQLAFRPGFSTKENITDVSGRGVGMDVVRTNIDLGYQNARIMWRSVFGRVCHAPAPACRRGFG